MKQLASALSPFKKMYQSESLKPSPHIHTVSNHFYNVSLLSRIARQLSNLRVTLKKKLVVRTQIFTFHVFFLRLNMPHHNESVTLER